ncbi:MAG: DUF5723 family protein, partial [Taibaiella sp.]|nr:DUF5723 family protein [Taibaiella sp.]
MRKIRLIILLAMMLPVLSYAQRYIGIATSNWSGTNGMYLNPANIADSRHKFTIDLFSINLGVNNNLAKLNGGVSGLTNIGDDGVNSALTFQNQSQFSLLAPYFELRGPGVMVSINSKHSFAITTRVRAMNQFHNFNQDLYRFVTDSTYGVNLNSNTPVSINADEFNYTTHGWSEIGLSYGGVIYDGGQHFVKGGLTLRYLMGAVYISTVSSGINAAAYPLKDSLIVSNTNLSFGSNITGGNFGSSPGDFLGGGGNGFGGDLGFVYEWRPDHATYKYDMDGKTGITDRSKNKYKLRFSASIVDFGSIKYKTNNFTANIRNKTGQTATMKGTELADSFGNYNDLVRYTSNHNLAVDSGTGGATSKVYLPTTLIIG